MKIKRVLSLVIVASLSFSLVLFSSPSASAEYVYNPYPASFNVFWNSLYQGVADFTGVNLAEFFDTFTFPVHGRVNSTADLAYARDYYNSTFPSIARTVLNLVAPGATNVYPTSEVTIVYDKENDIYRLADAKTLIPIVDFQGRFPYVEGVDVHGEEASPDAADPNGGGADVPATPSISNNKWVGLSSLANAVSVVSYDALAQLVVNLSDEGYTCSIVETLHNGVTWYMVRDNQRQVYCNSQNQPFVANKQSSATDIKYDYVINDNSTDTTTTVEDSQIIDVADGILNMVNENGERTEFYIDGITFNFDDHSYTVNAYDYTYNVTNNYYEYNYYTYNITYNIQNTYINYIGSTAEFQPTEYELYYELPDGRSSADLTTDELAGMSFQFHDVVNYKMSATDTYIKALYHFDGDTDDSSYFSTQGKFTWTKGASITYMESGAFNGALYLDTAEHAFNVKLPSRLGSGSATIQFRYYQASEPDTQDNIENRISIGGNNILRWDEGKLYALDLTSSCATLPVGTWSEIAIVRENSSGKSNYVNIYLNGLRVYRGAHSAIWNDTITFTFGATSRAYSMFDELRVVDFPIVTNGASYTCTAVPYDSNLVLTLPGDAYLIADEYWSFNTSGNKLKFSNFTNVQDPSSYWTTGPSSTYFSALNGYSTLYNSVNTSPGNVSVAAQGTYNSSITQYPPKYGLSYYLYCAYTGGSDVTISGGLSSSLTYGSTYTFSVVGTDGTVYSHTFSGASSSYTTFDWGYLGTYRYISGNNYYCHLWIYPKVGKTLEFVYAELKEGTSANTGHKLVSAVYRSDELQPNTAAVQSDIPVAGYTVGGVRPTFPVRGDVWFPVENKRITGCYIYNGSAWESVGCRYYTGSRWIPIYAFDMETLEDLYDIAGTDGVIVPITSEAGFWSWWQRQWLDFRSWLSGVNFGSGGSSGTIDETMFPAESPAPGEEGGGMTFIGLLGALKDGVWRLVTGIVSAGYDGFSGFVDGVGSLGDFFGAYSRTNSDGVFAVTNYTGDDIWD